ncbi:MAG: hypothetical protein JWN34_1866, partial [Bryobacterales bacterium]|nr:hypothetical protein [Bryobacterales bacterium]
MSALKGIQLALKAMTKNLLILVGACAAALFAQSPLTITTPNALPPATVGQA